MDNKSELFNEIKENLLHTLNSSIVSKVFEMAAQDSVKNGKYANINEARHAFMMTRAEMLNSLDMLVAFQLLLEKLTKDGELQNVNDRRKDR